MNLRLLLAAALLTSTALAQTLEEIVADPQLWPAEVTIKIATKATVLKDGQPGGAILIGSGKKISVSQVTADSVTGKLGGTTVRVPLAKTSLFTESAAAAPAAPAEEASAPAPAPAPEPAPTAAASPAPRAGATSPMQRMFGDNLVRFAGGRLQPVDASALAGVKYIALYYSASWCGPCRQFTPSLVTAYRELKAAHPEFELIFVSADHSASDMVGYMKQDAMPWLAVRYGARDGKMVDYSGPGIPCLVLVDARGNVLSDSFQGENYLGPQHVLADTRRILAQGR